MRILVDADACPVKESIVQAARERALEVLMFIDTSHELSDGYSSVITVDKGRDSVDLALINQAKTGDVIVTQDYGVAALALSKQCYALNQNGLVYTKDNIDKLLMERHINQKIRRAGGRGSHPKKRAREQDEAFRQALLYLLNK